MNSVSLLAARLRGVLAEAQEERPRRQELVEGPDGSPECAWAAYERGVMHAEVNRIRTQHERSEIPLELIERVERKAIGHSDYTSKFALYCAELALDVPRATY
ncbi:hypothetical protein ACFW2V_12610 [Streptomyces sp. NPDC058947]|uniref:hypothetical protein n=1 Tax=Streptomyces sp. NPDC058947 TaxID=3346675 RepID=UPI003697FC84